MADIDHCELCGRSGLDLTRHHLIPRMRHRNKRIQRRFSREQMQQQVLWLCRPCHVTIHDMISEKELANHYHTRERLLTHPGIAAFVRWIRSKPVGFRPKSRSWKGH